MSARGYLCPYPHWLISWCLFELQTQLLRTSRFKSLLTSNLGISRSLQPEVGRNRHSGRCEAVSFASRQNGRGPGRVTRYATPSELAEIIRLKCVLEDRSREVPIREA